MIVSVKIYQTPKSGNLPDEYEDALQPEEERDFTDPLFCAAMADGASEGFLSGEWARLLVKAFCESPGEPGGDHRDLLELIQTCYPKWGLFLKEYLERRQAENRPVQWYEEPGLENGAFATLLGLALLPDQSWSAWAVGDTCLFQIRQDRLADSFPIQKAETFNTWPALVSSNPARNLKLLEKIQLAEGRWQVEDCFLLMTDALSAWFLTEVEAGGQPWDAIREIVRGEKEDFLQWIEDLRGKNAIRNDDVTLMSLFISEC
jgi:hypothetical protein